MSSDHQVHSSRQDLERGAVVIANPVHHAISSSRKWGGTPDDYLVIHQWFDESKAHHADFRHRALRHHAQGIFWAEEVFGPKVKLSTCKTCGLRRIDGEHDLMLRSLENEFMEAGGRGVELADRIDALRKTVHPFEAKEIPTRWIGEQHVREDLGWIPALTDWLKGLEAEPWMRRSRPLSVELERVET